MANPSKSKGTGGETELLRLFASQNLPFVRTPASSPYDLTNAHPQVLELEPLEVLATRPDRGEWLVTLRQADFATLLFGHAFYYQSGTGLPLPGTWETHIEVKRYAHVALHTIFESKFGGKA